MSDPLRKSISMKRALLVVDVQNDFCEGGSLPVTGGAQVARDIRGHILRNQEHYTCVVFSKDWHIGSHSNGGHFADPDTDPDFVHTWPAHCVQESTGSEFHPGLEFDDLPDVIPSFHVFHKGKGMPAFSAFEGFNAVGHTLHTYLSRMAKVDSLDVVGIATDYCVKASFVDAAKHGYNTRLILPLTAAVGGPQGKLDACTAAELAGVTVAV